jgi:trehalose 6-phosphate phosphatase
MTTLPGLSTHRSALFLDFDGTLADLASRPDAVVVPPDLAALLDALHQRLAGAFALVTGRSRVDLLSLLPAFRWPAAFEHGAVRRTAHGIVMNGDNEELDTVITQARALAARHHGLLVEVKQTSLALHYRLNPALATTCVDTLAAAIENLPGLQLLQGKAVVEVKSARVGKGLAIEAFMQEAPFAGRVPVFAGDDVTDEAGFEAVHRLGGLAIKVGDGPTVAHHRCPHPQALRAWLQQFVVQHT